MSAALSSVVYFVQAGDGGPIKIGTTTDLPGRLRALQTGSATLLRVLATVPGDDATEKALHRQFSRLRTGGEWFVPHAELLALIQGAKLAVGRPATGLASRPERAAPKAPADVTAGGSRSVLAAIEATDNDVTVQIQRRK